MPFAALAAVAVAGMLMAWFVPQTALQEPLPWSWARARPTSEPAPPAAVEQVLRDGQRQALSSRTLSTPPEAVVAPGFLPVLLAATVVVAFVVLAVELPALALGTLVLGAAAGVVVVGLLLRRRLTSVGGLAG